jgi:hypothetical protein
MGSVRPPRTTPSLDAEALTVAMTVAPGVYARNRHFALYADARMRHARARASLLRGLARQLAGAEGPLDALAIDRASHKIQVRYRVSRLRLERTAELTPVEAACVFHLASRAGVPGFAVSGEDRMRLLAALRRLAALGDGAAEAMVLLAGTPGTGGAEEETRGG